LPKGVVTNSSATAGTFQDRLPSGANSTIGVSAAGGLTLSGGIGGAFTMTNAGTGGAWSRSVA